MKTISKLLLLTIILLLVSLGTISATENIQNTSQSTDTVYKEIPLNKEVSDISTENSIDTINQIKTIEKNDNINGNTKEAGRTRTVREETYDQYFADKTIYTDPDGNVITDVIGLVEGEDYTKSIIKTTTEYVEEGDTLNLRGEFNNLEFSIDKNITFTSINKDATLNNCKIYVSSTGTGSTISNLTIENNQDHVSAIVIDCSNNLLIENNHVHVNGSFAHPFDAITNNSIIRSNYFASTRSNAVNNRTHTAMVFCSSNYNVIANNTAFSDGANVIYLSIYPGQSGLGHGGPSNYNNITGNNISGADSSWSYTIQVLGANNRISFNNVSGGYKGISVNQNNIIYENDIDATSTGISVGENNLVYNNNVHMTTTGTGIEAQGTNIDILNNTVTTHGIALDAQASNLNISNNTLTSDSNGIYSKGGYNNITIENNKITTKQDGVLLGNVGVYKKVNGVYINNNVIVSESDYALNLQGAGALRAADVNITVTQSNVLTSAKGTGNVAYLPPSNVNSTVSLDTDQVITVNQQNYTSWFNDGVARDNILQNATVYLNGTFNNVNFEFIKKVHIIGQNALINNGTIILSQDAHASTITNVSIKNVNQGNGHSIELIEVNNCIITACTIENYAKYESFGIYLHSSSATTVSGNNITTSGDYVNNAIMVYGSISNTIEDNTILLNQSNVIHGYDNEIMFNDKIGTIQEVLHVHGIMLIYSSNNKINNNNIKGISQFDSFALPTNDCQNSIVGIDIYFESDGNTVTNNNINIESYGPFTYGMGVLGGQWGTTPAYRNSTNNIYKHNNVTLTGGYFTTGFIAGRNSIDTVVENNIFNVESRRNNTIKGDYGFGITLENSTTSSIKENQLTITAKAVYGMELFDSGSNTIFKNTLTGTGEYPYAVAGYQSSYNNITNNTFKLNKASYGEITSAAHADAVPIGDDGIMFMLSSDYNNITYNTIHTQSNYAVNISNETSYNIIKENSLLTINRSGDNAVLNRYSSNTISNNFIYFVNVTVTPITAKIGDQITLEAQIDSTTNDLSNLTAEFRLGTNIIGTSKVTNNKASLKYTVSTLLNPSVYQLTVQVSGNNFQNATGISQASISKDAEETIVQVSKITQTKNKTVKLTANVTTSSGGKIGTGQVEFYVDENIIGVVDVNLGVASIDYTIDSNALASVHTIKAIYLGTKDYAGATNTSILGIQSTTTITSNNIAAYLDENIVITADIKSDNVNVQSGSAKIFVDNIELGTATINNGKITYSGVLSGNKFNSGKYNLRISYEGNDTLSAASTTSTINIAPINPTFNYNTTSVNIGDKVVLTLVIDNGKDGSNRVVADGGNVSVLLNNEVLKDTNGNAITGKISNGVVSFSFTAPSALYGLQDIGFIFSGNSKFNQSSINYEKGLSIGKKSVLYLYTIDNNTSPIKITGKLLDDEGNGIVGAKLSLIIDTTTVTITTGGSGYFSYDYISSNSGNISVGVNYQGNNIYSPSSYSSSFMVNKKKVTLYLYNIDNSTSTVAISGKLLYEGKAISGSKLTLKINNNEYSFTPGSSGYFSYTITAENGVNNVEVTYAGNDIYEKSVATASFTSYAKKKATLYLYAIDNSTGSVVISGKLLGDGKAISGSKLTLKVNSHEYVFTPGSSGYFSYTVSPDTGVNDVTVTFAGNDVYAQTSATATFTSYAKKKATLYLYAIDNSTGSVVISGKLLGDGKAISGSKLTLKVNNHEYTFTPGSSGYFSYTVSPDTGVNDVTVTFAGNDVYAQTSTTASFTSYALKKPTLYLYAIDNSTGSVVISGKLLGNGKAISGSKLTLKVNSKTYTFTPGSSGYFSYTITAETGVNNVEVTFAGNDIYSQASATASFTSYAKKQVVLYGYALSDTKVGQTSTISGKLLTSDKKALSGKTVTINVGSKQYTATTNNDGYFAYKYQATTKGTQTITVSFNGDETYATSQYNTTLVVN